MQIPFSIYYRVNDEFTYKLWLHLHAVKRILELSKTICNTLFTIYLQFGILQGIFLHFTASCNVMIVKNIIYNQYESCDSICLILLLTICIQN